MNSPAWKVLVFGVALLLVLFAFTDASAQEEWPEEAGGLTRCVNGRPDMEIDPNVTVGSIVWVAYTVHEVAHVVQIFRAGGCEPFNRRMLVDEGMRGHPYRLQTEAEAYCAERAAGFYRGMGTLAEIALILSSSPLYTRWRWSFETALAALPRVCG
jgi:hypothetical protein